MAPPRRLDVHSGRSQPRSAHLRKTAALEPDFIVTVLIPLFALIGVLGCITANAHARTRRHLVRTSFNSAVKAREVRQHAQALAAQRTVGVAGDELDALYDSAEIEGLFDDADRLDRASIVSADIYRHSPSSTLSTLVSAVLWFVATVFAGRLAWDQHQAATAIDTGVLSTEAVITAGGAVVYLAVAVTFAVSYRMLVHDRAALADHSRLPGRCTPGVPVIGWSCRVLLLARRSE